MADGAPKGAIADAIKRDFGSFAQFQALFTDAATKHFGSGWVFLVVNRSRNRFEIVPLPNQDSVLVHGTPGLLCCDVWEHAYYLKYRNHRPDYLSAWWNVIAWDVVDERLRDVMAETGGTYAAIRRARVPVIATSIQRASPWTPTTPSWAP